MNWQKNIYALGLSVLAACVTPVEAMSSPVDQDSVNDAASRAIARMVERNKGPVQVSSAVELVAAHDSLCIYTFGYVSPTSYSVLGNWCVTQEGAYEKRAAGLNQSYLRQVRRYIFQYPQRGDWEDFERNIWLRPDIFAEVQYLVRNDAQARERLIWIIVGHQTVDPLIRNQ